MLQTNFEYLEAARLNTCNEGERDAESNEEAGSNEKQKEEMGKKLSEMNF